MLTFLIFLSTFSLLSFQVLKKSEEQIDSENQEKDINLETKYKSYFFKLKKLKP